MEHTHTPERFSSGSQSGSFSSPLARHPWTAWGLQEAQMHANVRRACVCVCVHTLTTWICRSTHSWNTAQLNYWFQDHRIRSGTPLWGPEKNTIGKKKNQFKRWIKVHEHSTTQQWSAYDCIPVSTCSLCPVITSSLIPSVPPEPVWLSSLSYSQPTSTLVLLLQFHKYV